MAGLFPARERAVLDLEFPVSASTDAVAYSTNGTSEAALLARTPIGAAGWAAATVATPSVKANNTALVSAPVSSSGTITHFAVFSATSGGFQKTDWTALTASRAVVATDTVQWPIGSLQVTLD